MAGEYFEAKLLGAEDLNRALRELTADLKKKVLRGALRDAARPIARQARSLAPVLKDQHPYRLPGTLARSIVVRNSKVQNGQGGEIGVYVSVRKRAKLGGKASARNPFDPFYWRFLEFGTRKMRARRFMLPAFEAQREQALAIVQARIRARIEQANRRK
jgi:HK97 gp10 family phage protein